MARLCLIFLSLPRTNADDALITGENNPSAREMGCTIVRILGE